MTYEMVKRNFDRKLWNAAMVRKAVEKGVITRWRDHADLAEVPLAEKDRWRRLSAARW